jgi:hypothetical protein
MTTTTSKAPAAASRISASKPRRSASLPAFAVNPSSTYVSTGLTSVQPMRATNSGSSRSCEAIVWRSRCLMLLTRG